MRCCCRPVVECTYTRGRSGQVRAVRLEVSHHHRSVRAGDWMETGLLCAWRLDGLLCTWRLEGEDGEDGEEGDRTTVYLGIGWRGLLCTLDIGWRGSRQDYRVLCTLDGEHRPAHWTESIETGLPSTLHIRRHTHIVHSVYMCFIHLETHSRRTLSTPLHLTHPPPHFRNSRSCRPNLLQSPTARRPLPLLRHFSAKRPFPLHRMSPIMSSSMSPSSNVTSIASVPPPPPPLVFFFFCCRFTYSTYSLLMLSR